MATQEQHHKEKVTNCYSIDTETSPLVLKVGAVLEAQARLIRLLQSSYSRDSLLSIEEYQALAHAVAQSQALLTAGSNILQANKEVKNAQELSHNESGDVSKDPKAAELARLQAVVEYVCARVAVGDPKCNSYSKIKALILEQVGPSIWDAHQAFVNAEVKHQIIQQLTKTSSRSRPDSLFSSNSTDNNDSVSSVANNYKQKDRRWQTQSMPTIGRISHARSSVRAILKQSKQNSASMPSVLSKDYDNNNIITNNRRIRAKSSSVVKTQSLLSKSSSVKSTTPSPIAMQVASSRNNFEIPSQSPSREKKTLHQRKIQHHVQHSVWAWGERLCRGRAMVSCGHTNNCTNSFSNPRDTVFQDVHVGLCKHPVKLALWPFVAAQRVTQVCANGERAFIMMHNGDLYQWDFPPAEETDASSFDATNSSISNHSIANSSLLPPKSLEKNTCSTSVISTESGYTHRHKHKHSNIEYGKDNCGHYVIPKLVPIHELIVRRALTPAWKAVNIACGPRHILCITDAGQLLSWGKGADGRLGHGDFLDVPEPKVVLALASQQMWQISCGNAHSLGITVDGSLYTWGRGANGRLGHGDQANVATPKQLNVSAYDRITSSTSSSALSSFSTPSIVNTTSTSPSSQDRSSSTCSNVISSTANVTTSSSSSSSLTENKQLRSSNSRKMVPQQFEFASCGWNFTAVVTTNGDVFCMGRGTEGQCGSQTVVDRLSPHVVETLRGKRFFVTSVACGCRHTLALCRGGDVFSWGLGEQGQLGSGAAYCPLPEIVKFPKAKHKTDESSISSSSSSSSSSKKSESYISSKSSSTDGIRLDHDCVSEVACGPWHSVAITAKGRVFTWGANRHRQLGLGDVRDRSTPQLVRGLPQNINVGSVACTATTTLLMERHNYHIKDVLGAKGKYQASINASTNTRTNGTSSEKKLAMTDGQTNSKTINVPVNDKTQPIANSSFFHKYQSQKNKNKSPGFEETTKPTKKMINKIKRKMVDSWRDMVRPSALKYASPREQHFYNVERSLSINSSASSFLRRGRDDNNRRSVSAKAVSSSGKLLTHTRYSIDAFDELTSHLHQQEIQNLHMLQFWNTVVLPNWVRVWMALISQSNIHQVPVIISADVSKDGYLLANTRHAGDKTDLRDKFFHAATLSNIFDSYPDVTSAKTRSSLHSNLRGRSRSCSSSTASSLTTNLSSSISSASTANGSGKGRASCGSGNNNEIPNPGLSFAVLNLTTLWQEGIPVPIRAWVWPQLIGNSLRITPAVFLLARQRVQQVRLILNKGTQSRTDGSGLSFVSASATEHVSNRSPKSAAKIDTNWDANMCLRHREKTIQLINTDLPRTLPYLRLFGKGEALSGIVQDALETFVCFRPEIGYLQGLSYIAAVLALFMRARRVHDMANKVSYSQLFSTHASDWYSLLHSSARDTSNTNISGTDTSSANWSSDCHRNSAEHLEDVYIVFQCLANLIVSTRPFAPLPASTSTNTHTQAVTGLGGAYHLYHFFLLNETKINEYYNIFDVALEEEQPQLRIHLSNLGITYDVFLFMWLQTVFLRVLPLQVAVQVWDLFLLGGTPVLFKTALALLHHMSDALRTMKFEDCINLLTCNNKESWAHFTEPRKLMESIGRVSLSNKVMMALAAIGCSPIFSSPNADLSEAKQPALNSNDKKTSKGVFATESIHTFASHSLSAQQAVRSFMNNVTVTAPRDLKRILDNLPMLGF